MRADSRHLSRKNLAAVWYRYHLSPEALVAAGCGLAGRDLTTEERSRFVPDGFEVPQVCG